MVSYMVQAIQSFNPRTHEECDSFQDLDVVRRSVSIHALTRSATILYLGYHGLGPVSIHALTRSATNKMVSRPLSSSGFNPRTHEECDPKILSISSGVAVSIHALTRSATYFTTLALSFLTVSIHALTRSATCKRLPWKEVPEFQSTHSRGVRPCLSLRSGT